MRPTFGSRADGLTTTLAALALVAATARVAAAQCGGTQLCGPGAGDCSVTAACTITLPPGGLTIDLGARRLVITKTLTVDGPAGAGLFLKVGDLLIDGGTILALGASGIAGNVSILSATNVTVRNTGTIDVSGAVGAGLVELAAQAGDLDFDGRIKANGTARMAYGGEVDLFASGSMTIDGPFLDVSGGDLGGAGFLTLEGLTGSLDLMAPIKAFGGDGGDIDMAAGTTLRTTSSAVLNTNANGDAGSGGAVDISAGGDVVIGGETIGTGSLPDFQTDGRFGGDGADLDVFSENGSVTVNGRIDISAAAGGSGGALDIEAATDLSFSKPVIAQSGSIDGIGGDAFLIAGGTMSLPDSIDVSGATGSGGSIEAYAAGNLTVSGSLKADGDLLGGTTLLTGCAVNVPSTGLLSARGPGGLPLASNIVRASSTMTIAGTLRATTRNLLEYRTVPAPTVTGSVTPAETVSQNSQLACCVSCPVTTTTTSTSSTSSTTSTTVGTTTTTSSTIAANTTTSTTAPPTTTTTSSLPPATTTTSSLPPATTTTSAPPTTTTSLPPTTTTSLPPATTTTTTLLPSTTTTSAPTTTSTTSPTTTSTTATTTQPTSTIFATTTTSVESSTSTSSSPAPVATTTTQPVTPSCGSNEPPPGGAACGVALLTAQVDGATVNQLGGKATANRLRASLRRANRFLDSARGGKNVGPSLRRALREIKSFERAVQQGLRRKRRPIDAAVGNSILSLSVDARAEIGFLQASPR